MTGDQGGASADDRPLTASVIIPAHNEETTLGRLLSRVAGADDLDVMVVCNGCSDRSAEVARGFGVRVLEIAEASKTAALRAGAMAAHSPLHVFVDADVVIDAAALRALASAVDVPDPRVAGPHRTMDASRSSWAVRSYLRFWERLPTVRSSLAGRGVLALSPAAVQRLGEFPDVVADDLLVHRSFAPSERVEVSSVDVTVVAPRRVNDLVRRRIRVLHGTEDVARRFGPDDGSRTSRADLVATARDPQALPGLPVFVCVTAWARWRARNSAPTGWLRDDSSR